MKKMISLLMICGSVSVAGAQAFAAQSATDYSITHIAQTFDSANAPMCSQIGQACGTTADCCNGICDATLNECIADGGH